MRVVAAGLVLAAVLAGCAQDGDETASQPAAPAETELTIVVRLPELGGGGRRYRLRCDPPGGTHPDARAACAALAENPDALEPVPLDTACTEQFGGPETAQVEGTFRGRAITATFSRKNGCEIARWDALAPVFPTR